MRSKQHALACMKLLILKQGVCGTHVLGFCFSDDLYQIQIASPDGSARLLFAEVDSGCGIFQLVRPTRPQRPPYPPLKRATKQTGLDKHRSETYPFRLGRNPITSGVHLQRPLYLYLCQPRFLRTIGTGTQPHQCRKRKPTTDLLLPLRPNQHTERDDQHPRQSVMIRRLHRGIV